MTATGKLEKNAIMQALTLMAARTPALLRLQIPIYATAPSILKPLLFAASAETTSTNLLKSVIRVKDVPLTVFVQTLGILTRT